VNVHAQTLPSTPAVLDYITFGTQAIDDLVTSHMELFVADGLRLANVLAVLVLTMKAIGWMFHGVSSWHAHFALGPLIEFLGKLACVLILLHYYNNPLPGSAVSFHQIFSYTGRLIGASIDLQILNDFLARCAEVLKNLQKPISFDVIGIAEYLYVLVNLALIEGILFVITIFGFIAIGIGSLVGPLFIPLLLVPNLSSLFWRWVNSMMVYSFYQVVAKAMIFVWCHIVVAFFSNAIHGDYSIGGFLYLLVPFGMLNVGFIFSLSRVPSLAAEYFGGLGSVGASLGAAISRSVQALF
jgi:type IV secretion system protein VirB6